MERERERGNRKRLTNTSPQRTQSPDPPPSKTRTRSDTPIYVPSPPLSPGTNTIVLPTLELNESIITHTHTTNSGALASVPTLKTGPQRTLNAWVFEIVMKTFVGDAKQKYWYYASYPEFNLDPNPLQKKALKNMVDHLNGGTPSRSLRSVRCKNIFESGDHQLIAETKGTAQRRARTSRNSEWLMLRS